MHPSFSHMKTLYKNKEDNPCIHFSQKQSMATQQQQMELKEKDQELIFKIAMSFNFIIPILIGLLLLTRDQSPFETHPSNMCVFMISTLIYYSVTLRSMPSAALISGSLTSILLLCFFLPRWLGLVILIVWVFVTVSVAYKVHAA
ncbi:hypothetical protein Dsin_026394 [Dipteronia sinensis]|uniref:Uncharacterized protein n=1 Tax=Dipteronia sinensis TaxID=43782 RepID=A0AAD9ZY41_9ROSI|nr:hypothetical protein Dsin_026394 [Dipteronia sinensis]